jgi:hypothetical protein
MMETAGTSETSVNFYQTARRNSPENSHLQDTAQKAVILKKFDVYLQ